MKPAKFEMRQVADLKNWEQNPRTILKKEFERLKAQIQQLGVYKTLLVNQDNIVLGGNMRLRAFQELGLKEVMCGVVQTENEAQMLEYALSDNDQAGVTDEQAVAQLAMLHPINSELYAIHSRPAKLLQTALQELSPDGKDDQFGLPDGEKEPFQQMTFALADEQVKLIKQALEKGKEIGGETFGNENTNGNALYWIVKQWLG